MDENNDDILEKILTKEESNEIPDGIKVKVNKYFTQTIESLITDKAIGEAAKNRLDEIRDQYERQLEDLSIKLQDYEAKLSHSQQNVNELREQLDASREEVAKLLEATKRYENDTAEYRRERNDAIDERDSLLKLIERRNSEIERLQGDLKTYGNQLQAAINAKCEALAKLDEIEGKENSLEYKEKRMDQEKAILTSQVQSLSQDLHRNISELQTIRRENTTRCLELETKLNQKIEEVKIANSEIAYLNELVGQLTAKSEELSGKLLAQNEESSKMMEHYKKELLAKSKLVDLYKLTDEEKVAERKELENTIVELRKVINEATDQYGDLETKLKATEIQHEQEIEERNNIIQSLKDELRNANDLLKEAQEENLDNAVGRLAPSAAVTSRLMKSDMSLTELYSMYVKTTEDLQLQKKENSRLTLQMKTFLQELEEKAPIIKRQGIENEKLIQANQELSIQLEKLISGRVESREELQDNILKIGHLERENKKLKIAQSDLARQVCYLLKEIEQMRGGYSSEAEQSISSDMSANEVISKKLVTFNNITELQETNQKLLLLVRDLSSKLEEMEEVQTNMDQASYEVKISSYSKRLQEMQESQEYQTQMMNVCMQQRDRYKKLYYDALKCSGKNIPVNENSLNDQQMEGIDEDNTPLASNSSVISNEAIAIKDKRINELEEKIKELTNQINTIKEEHDEYRKEKLTNEKMMNEQFDSMRSELRELTSTNCKLMSSVEYNNEQIKIQQKNVATYKKQISTLEERNRNYENTIVKHEQTIMFLKDEAMSAQQKLSCAEVQVENLKQECRLLRDSESRLQLEREALHRERQTQNLLLNSIEMIKTNFERSESEGRLRMESRLDEATRECSALRRRLQEEQDEFKELSNHLKRQAETYKERMEEEKANAVKLRDELSILRDDLNGKSKQIEDLSRKLQESLTPSQNDNPIAQANKKAREFELKYEEARLEIESLMKELNVSKEHVQQYCKMAQSSEKELKEYHDIHEEYKNKAEAELQKLRLSEANLQTRVEQLESEVKIQITEAQIDGSNSSAKATKVQGELKEALQKLSDNNRVIRDLKDQINTLTVSLQNVEQKYANEMILHSADIQDLTKAKEELLKVREQVDELKISKNNAIAALNEFKKGINENEAKVLAEKSELEKRLLDLDAQNSSLHDQIQLLSSKLTFTNASNGNNESMNDSSMQDISITNRSMTEEEAKNNEQLLQIIKYLRKEKDIAVAKVDILKAENVRLQSEQQILQKKLNELTESLRNERTETEAVAVTATKHEEILRKVETLHAITDSNRILREERDALTKRVKELTDRISKVEDELFPLQEKKRELEAKIEECSAENTSLRTEAIKWRQRANVLVERSNKNPEEFKRLQNERESLAKMLATERDVLKQVQEELSNVKCDKSRLEVEISNLHKQIQNLTEENKKALDDNTVLRQQNAKMSHEVMELKNQLLQKDENLRKATDDLATKEEQLVDSRNREIQIRKIAKRYKDSFIELKSKGTDGKEGENANDAGDSQTVPDGETSAPKQDTEKEFKEKLNELNSQIKTIQEQCDILRKENETLKSSAEREDRSKTLLLKEAKTRIMSLTEAKNAVNRELTQTKTQLQNLEQNREEHEMIITSLKSQYETQINRLEKERTEIEKENKEAISRLTQENETLLLRINQLHRQLGVLQASKPSTSSGSSGDKSSCETLRTANVKPMSGPSGQQSATVTPWRGGETPLASIRPMSVQNSRTAAVLPTSQTSNTASTIQGSSSGSVTALVPPQQQVHTTGNSSGEAMSSSPTSSHTDYMPATSSAAVVVAAVPPMGSSAESSQEAESVQNQNNESSSSSQIVVSGGQQQQAVALVSPRVEGAQNITPAQSQQSVQSQENIQPSTSGTSSSSNISVSSHHQASSSNTVTTTQAGGHKRPRDVEGDSSTSNEEVSEKSQPQMKRTRMQAGEVVCQGVSESGLDVEYQVPTSSQRDQEDDIIIVDSEDDGMADEGNAEVDDGPIEDDNGEAYEMEEAYEQEQDIDEGEGPDIDEDNAQSDNNEVEVDDSSEVPNQSETTTNSNANNQMAPDGGSSQIIGQSSADQDNETQNQNSQQIQTISSGSDGAGSSSQTVSQTSSTWRQSLPLTRQQQATLLMLQQGYDETGDDSIVPSTPTLYATRRSDGFSEAVSSPHSQVPLSTARFTFSESRPGVSNEGRLDEIGMNVSDDATGRSVPSTPQQTTSPHRDSNTTIGEGSSSTEKLTSQPIGSEVQDPVAGPSHVEGNVPEITVTTAAEDVELAGETASQSEVQDGEQSQLEEGDMEEGEGLDGVTSEGEKASGGAEESVEIEEGREAEASTSPSINTRSRAIRTTPQARRSTRGGHQRRPIVWSHEQSRGGPAGARNLNQNLRMQNDSGSPQRGSFQSQRGQRARRMRRPSGSNYGGGPRF